MHTRKRREVEDCQHKWERRADLDDLRILRFACSKCGVLACRKLSPRAPIRPYRDRRTQMPTEREDDAPPSTERQTFFRDVRSARGWAARKAWNDMLRRGT